MSVKQGKRVQFPPFTPNTMDKVTLIRANTIAECRRVKELYPEAELVGWPSSIREEDWFFHYKLTLKEGHPLYGQLSVDAGRL